MFDAYKIAIRIAVFSNATQKLRGIAVEVEQIGKATKGLSGQLSVLAGRGGPVAMAVAGLGMMAYPILKATSAAARFQNEMVGIQLATGATQKQMDALSDTIKDLSTKTLFSSMDVAGIAKKIGTGTTLTPSQLNSILPTFTLYADVIKGMKGENWENSVTDAIRMSHMAKAYTPTELRPILNRLAETSTIVPGSMGEIAKALPYVLPTAQSALGMDPKDIVELVALANQIGFAGSKGGTNLTAAMIRTIPGMIGGSQMMKFQAMAMANGAPNIMTGYGTSNQIAALMDLGLMGQDGKTDLFKGGHFHWREWIHKLIDARSRMMKEPGGLERFARDLKMALGTIGTRMATSLGDPKAIEQLQKIDERLKSLDEKAAKSGASDYLSWFQGSMMNKSTLQQWRVAITNIQTLLIEIGNTALGSANEGLKAFNRDISDLISYIRTHQKDISAFTGAMIDFISFVARVGIVFAKAMAMIPHIVFSGGKDIEKFFEGVGNSLKDIDRKYSPGVIGGPPSKDVNVHLKVENKSGKDLSFRVHRVGIHSGSSPLNHGAIVPVTPGLSQ